jgi:porphobilinogen deaminase
VKTIILGARGSQLALAQAELAKQAVERLPGRPEAIIRITTTTGDPPDLHVTDVRGNVPTRIAKLLAEDSWNSLVLAKPHSAPRTVLLKVNLIQSPEVYVWLNGQLSKFFYAPLVEADQHGR